VPAAWPDTTSTADLTNPGEFSHHGARRPQSAPPVGNPAWLRPVSGSGGGTGGGRSYPGGFRNPYAS